MHSAAKPGEGTELTREVLREFAGLHHALTQVAGVKVRAPGRRGGGNRGRGMAGRQVCVCVCEACVCACVRWHMQGAGVKG